MISEKTWQEKGEEILKYAGKVFNSKKDYERYMISGFRRLMREDVNKYWVTCWECGRRVAPGQATWDGNGWYCGC